MLDEMEDLIGALARVGNDIAHDLRTVDPRPPGAGRGRTNTTTLPELQASADKAIVGIDQSLTIIATLLRLTEIENGRRSAGFRQGGAGRSGGSRRSYEPIVDDKRIALKTDLPATASSAFAQPHEVHGDRDLLIEAIANLVDNAVKSTPAGGQVEIALTSDDRAARRPHPGFRSGHQRE